MNLKQINEILKNLNELQNNKLKKIIKLNKTIKSDLYDDGGPGECGGQMIQIFDIVGHEDIKLKVVSYNGSYGQGEFVNEVQFVKVEEVESIEIDPDYIYEDEEN